MVVDEEAEELSALLAGAVVVVLCAGIAGFVVGLDEAGVFAVLWLDGEDTREGVSDCDDEDHATKLVGEFREVFEGGKGNEDGGGVCWGRNGSGRESDGENNWVGWPDFRRELCRSLVDES